VTVGIRGTATNNAHRDLKLRKSPVLTLNTNV